MHITRPNLAHTISRRAHDVKNRPVAIEMFTDAARARIDADPNSFAPLPDVRSIAGSR